MGAGLALAHLWQSKIDTISPRILVSPIVLLTVGGCFSRFFRLGRESLWCDEALNLDLAWKASRIHCITSWADSHPPLYYFILHGWMKIFGSSEWAMRSLSAVFGVLLIIATYYIGRKMISREAGVIAAILVLVNPVALYYSQEARMYSFIPILILLSTYYFYRFLSCGDRRFLGLYVVFAAFLIYTDYLGVVVLAIHWLFLLVWFGWTRDTKRLLTAGLAFAAVACLYIPWIPNILHYLDWSQIEWIEVPGFGEGITVALNLMGIEFTAPHYTSLDLIRVLRKGIPSVLVAISGALFLIMGLLSSLREAKTFKSLLAMLCFGPAALFVISVVKTPVFNLRQTLGYQPAIALTIAAGLLAVASHVPKRLPALSSRSAWTLLLIPLLLVNLRGVYRLYTVDTKTDWRTVGGEESDRGHPIVICPQYIVPAFKYYYRGSEDITGTAKKDLEGVFDTVDAQELTLIISHHEPKGVPDTVRQDFEITKELNYRGVDAYLLRRKPESSPGSVGNRGD